MDSINTEQILRYLDGEMTPEEKLRFEESLSRNKPLADESQRLSMAIDAVKYLGITDAVQKAHLELKAEGSIEGLNDRKVIPMRRILRYGMAAAACLLFLFIGFKTFEFYTLSPDKLYAQAFVDYELSANRSTAPQKQGIEAAYQNKDYQKVITLSGASTALTPAEHFYAGLSYLHTNQFPAAITHLQTTASTNNTQKADAEYYLAMAHLKNHDYDKAIGLMEKINNDKTHPYNDQFSRQYIRKVKMLKWR